MIKKILSSFVIISSLIGPFAFLARPAEAAVQFQGVTSALLSCTGADKTISQVLNFGKNQESEEAVGTDSKKENQANEDTKKRETCLKKISRIIIKQLMDKLTYDTISWINGGFKGEPLFVKNPETFYTSIIDTEVANFAGLTAWNKDKYPFGKDFAIGMINQYKGQFALAAQSSLANYVSTGRPADFYTNFSTGGWDAWMGLVTNPANNPIGYTMMASDEVARRTQDSNNNWFVQGGSNPNVNEVRQEIASAGGFLAQKKCSVSKSSDPNIEYNPEPTGLSEAELQSIADQKLTEYQQQKDLNGDGSIATMGDVNQASSHICGRWDTVTPGQTISGQLDTALGSPFKSLDLNADFSDSMSAIFDALFNQLANKGLTALADAIGGDAGTQYAGVGNNSGELDTSLFNGDQPWSTYGQGLTLKDMLITGYDHDNNGDGPSNNKTVIDIQKDWIKMMAGDNWENNPNSFVDHGVNDALFWLIRNTKRLDYWVPGPRPDWETIATEKFYQQMDKVVNYEPSGTEAFLQSFVGILSGGSGNDLWAQARTQTRVDMGEGMNGLFNDYKASIDLYYNNTIFPGIDIIRSITFPEIQKLSGYEATFSQNQKDIENVFAALHQMEFLKTKITPLYEDLEQLQSQLGLDPTNTSLQNQITAIQKQIDKYKKIFDTFAPNLKNFEEVEGGAVLKELYDGNSQYIEDLINEVKKETYDWPNIARRPYNSSGIWPDDPESKCWDTTHNPVRLAASGTVQQQAQQFIASVNQYDESHGILTTSPEHLPGNALATWITNTLSGPYYGVTPEYGNQQCSLLPQGIFQYTSYDPTPDQPNSGDEWNKTNEGSAGAINLPSGMGGDAQDNGGIFPLAPHGSGHEGLSYMEDLLGIY